MSLSSLRVFLLVCCLAVSLRSVRLSYVLFYFFTSTFLRSLYTSFIFVSLSSFSSLFTISSSSLLILLSLFASKPSPLSWPLFAGKACAAMSQDCSINARLFAFSPSLHSLVVLNLSQTLGVSLSNSV